MFHRASSGICRAKIQANQKHIRAAAIIEARKFSVEMLEPRLFLSASGPSVQALAGPLQVAGNSCTYELDVDSVTGVDSGEETFASTGAATSPSGQKGFEVETTTTE